MSRAHRPFTIVMDLVRVGRHAKEAGQQPKLASAWSSACRGVRPPIQNFLPPIRGEYR
jgi:hypothetical protein